VPCQHHTVAGAARTPVESTVVVYDGSNWRHKLIRPIGGSAAGTPGLQPLTARVPSSAATTRTRRRKRPCRRASRFVTTDAHCVEHADGLPVDHQAAVKHVTRREHCQVLPRAMSR